MATFLFDDIVFGPVRSRRLGASLGINLLPVGSKCCTFNCIYCECGWTGEGAAGSVLPG
jgi:wyosine [tRNA(Phe)-imidazoG37] synthetase (radical SAM superfamily)